MPLARNASIEVTDANKRDFLRRSLRHQLVLTIEAQARAFREGVEDVIGTGWLPLLSASELKQVWGGHTIDDAHLQKWRERTNAELRVAGRLSPGAARLEALFFQWLQGCSEARRAEVLQFATGAARLPSDAQLASWTFSIEELGTYATVTPTESNGLSAPAMLARASTCSKTLMLPPYEDVAALARGMEFSLMDGGFGVA